MVTLGSPAFIVSNPFGHSNLAKMPEGYGTKPQNGCTIQNWNGSSCHNRKNCEVYLSVAAACGPLWPNRFYFPPNMASSHAQDLASLTAHPLNLAVNCITGASRRKDDGKLTLIPGMPSSWGQWQHTIYDTTTIVPKQDCPNKCFRFGSPRCHGVRPKRREHNRRQSSSSQGNLGGTAGCKALSQSLT